MGRSVGYFFLLSQIPYPLNLIVNSPNLVNKIKYTNNAKAKKKIVVFQVPCQKKTGSVGRLYFFFFFR